ncbi:MAG: hypothetical protein GEV03_27685 [Streptosporangiales bacterium]|nr:hypothetical protein [Streptosporangiales bacterium]
MRIVNPTFGHPEHVAETSASRPLDWRYDPMCVFSNSKPNANELLHGVRTRLEEVFGRDDVAYEAKQSAAVPADPDMIDWLAEQYRLAVLAIGD